MLSACATRGANSGAAVLSDTRCSPDTTAFHRFPFGEPRTPEDTLLLRFDQTGRAWGETREAIVERFGVPLRRESIPTPNRHTGGVDSTVILTYADHEFAFWWSPVQGREHPSSVRVSAPLQLPGGLRVAESTIDDVVLLLGSPAYGSVTADTTRCGYWIDHGVVETSVHFGFIDGVLRWILWLPYHD